MDKSKKNPTIALIVAAGSSSRMGRDIPKPYLQAAGKYILSHVLEAFTSHPGIDAVRVVINRAHHPLYKKAASGFNLFPPVVGGKTRQDSVRIGLEAIKRVHPGKVLIHDAARPCVDHALIDRVLAGLENTPAVLPVTEVMDTIRNKSGELVDRSELVAAQTPQGFDFEAIYAAHQQYKNEAVTDDIALAQLAGLQVDYVAGDARNIKLTTADQLPMMEASLQKPSAQIPAPAMETRVGQGFDVHAFEDSGPDGVITLCGLELPHDKKLKGHSDADVGLHAIVDALLGAISEGDIGQHFLPSDPRWKGANSRQFVQHAKELVKKQGGQIVHVDLTIMGEEPKISAYRTAMRQQIAALLELDVRRVSVKATTTEKLGFLGRSEGLAAQAVATIKLPESL